MPNPDFAGPRVSSMTFPVSLLYVSAIRAYAALPVLDISMAMKVGIRPTKEMPAYIRYGCAVSL